MEKYKNKTFKCLNQRLIETVEAFYHHAESRQATRARSTFHYVCLQLIMLF